jgi:hypothetical protein
LALLRKITGRADEARALLLRAKEVHESLPTPDPAQLQWLVDELRGLEEGASLPLGDTTVPQPAPLDATPTT